MKQIAERIYYSDPEPEVDRPCLGYLQGEKHTLLVDAGNSPAHVRKIREELKELGLREPDYIVLTHSHWDHTYGLCAWKGISYASVRTNEYLKEMSRWNWEREEFERHVASNEIPLFCRPHMLLEYPKLRRRVENIPEDLSPRETLSHALPSPDLSRGAAVSPADPCDPPEIQVKPADRTISVETDLDLGGLTCRMIPVISPHTDDCVLVYVPEQRLLFTGDAGHAGCMSREEILKELQARRRSL